MTIVPCSSSRRITRQLDDAERQRARRHPAPVARAVLPDRAPRLAQPRRLGSVSAWPMGLVGRLSAGSYRSTSVWVIDA